MPKKPIVISTERREIDSDLRAMLTQVNATLNGKKRTRVSYLEIRNQTNSKLTPIETHQLLHQGVKEGYLYMKHGKYGLTIEGQETLGKRMSDEPIPPKKRSSYLTTRLYIGTADPNRVRSVK